MVNISQYLDSVTIVNLETNALYSIDSITAKKRNVLVFWAPDCPFCDQLFEEFANFKTNINLVCFPVEVEIEGLSDYFQTRKNIWPQLLTYDNRGVMVNPFQISSIPTIIITDKKGNIVYSQVGAELRVEFINAIK